MTEQEKTEVEFSRHLLEHAAAQIEMLVDGKQGSVTETVVQSLVAFLETWEQLDAALKSWIAS